MLDWLQPVEVALATVLMTWELGGGMGHVARLLPVARELAAQGHRPVLAVKNLVEPAPLLADVPFPILQSPFWHPRQWFATGPFVANSYADILATRGFADPATLYPMVQAWHGLIELVRPELIVCDYSPTLCLAAFGDLPVVEVGDGFTMPPIDATTFPSLAPDAQPLVPQEQVLNAMRQVQQRRGRKVPDSLPALFDHAGRFIMTWPELDPYRAVRREPLLGPLNSVPLCSGRPDKPCFFAYLSADYPAVHQILAQLVKAGIAGEVHVRNAVSALQDHLQASGLIVHDQPQAMSDVLARASFIIHHASLGTAESALWAGCPQFLLPRHLEQKLTAEALRELDVGTYVSGKISMSEIIQTARSLCSPHYAETAAQLANSLHAREATHPLRQVVARCVELL